jgi:hypothetical protein
MGNIDHWQIIQWTIALIGSSVVIILGAIYFVFRQKADVSALNLFVQSCGKTRNGLEKDIIRIENHVANVDRQVYEIKGGILMAIGDFRATLEKQMALNQELIMQDMVVRKTDK